MAKRSGSSVTSRLWLVLLAGVWSLPVLADVTESDARCQDCVAGPFQVSKFVGRPVSELITFPSFAGSGYELVIRNWSLSGAGARISLNGLNILDVHGLSARGSPPVPISVVLEDENVLDVRIRGGFGQITVEIRSTVLAQLPSCGTPELREVFTEPLMAPDVLVAVEPLGRLVGPSHTLPTHHLTFSPPRIPFSTLTYPVSAPAKVRVVAVEYIVEDNDFQLYLRPCDEIRMYLQHLESLSDRLAARVGDPLLWSPIPAEVAELGEFLSVALTSIDMAPGELLGYTRSDDQAGLNVGLVDTRQPDLPFVNPMRYEIPADVIPGPDPVTTARIIREIAPDRLRQHCALDYFEPAIAAPYIELLGNLDGTVLRTEEPLCGEHMQDIASTAQGNWFRPTEPGGEPSLAIDEHDDFAFAHDNVTPSQPTISLSDSGPLITEHGDITNRVFYSPNLSGEGRINRDPADIVSGPVYCFDSLSSLGGSLPGYILMQLPNATTLRIGYNAADVICSDALAALPPDTELGGPDIIEFER